MRIGEVPRAATAATNPRQPPVQPPGKTTMWKSLLKTAAVVVVVIAAYNFIKTRWATFLP